MEDWGPDGGGRYPGVHHLLPELGPVDELHLQGHRIQQARNILPSQISRCSKFTTFHDTEFTYRQFQQQ